MKLSTAKSMSIKLLIGLLTLVILFHGCIMAKIIPYGIAWGGRLENDTQMYIFESVSILINAFLITVLLLKANYIHHRFSDKLLHGILWVFQLLFILNTIGNILAKTNFEKFFAILTFAFAMLIWIILKKDKNITDASNA